MVEKIMTSNEKELAKVLHETRDDPDEWEESADEIEVRREGSQVVSFRIPAEEFELLLEAVEKTGDKLSTYLRKALLLCVHGTPVGPSVDVSGDISIRSHLANSRRNESAEPVGEQIVPDYPPEHASL